MKSSVRELKFLEFLSPLSFLSDNVDNVYNHRSLRTSPQHTTVERGGKGWARGNSASVGEEHAPSSPCLCLPCAARDVWVRVYSQDLTGERCKADGQCVWSIRERERERERRRRRQRRQDGGWSFAVNVRNYGFPPVSGPASGSLR